MLPLLSPPGAAHAQETPPTLRVGVLSDGVRIDGMLEEADWAQAEVTEAFTQVEPREGNAPTGRTTVRVVAASQIPSQSGLSVSPPGLMRPSYRAPLGLTEKM